MTNVRNLDCYDKRASFYGKAKVCEDERSLTLESYGEKICSYDKGDGTLKIIFDPAFSTTTLRHFRSFLCEIGFYHDITKAAVEAMDKEKLYSSNDFYNFIDSKKAYQR